MRSGISGVSDMGQVLDFGGDPLKIRALIHALRLRHGIAQNPEFASETALIDPLPHQQLAVYDHMLKQDPLRFLLADDAGAGKTIMTGLYIRTLLFRQRIRRILIVSPAGLVGNWRSEMEQLFQLEFHIVGGANAKKGNPFVGPESDLLIASIDSLGGSNLFGQLQSREVEPYELAVFDEAHKLSFRFKGNGQMERSRRYRLAEALAGVQVKSERWCLPWSSHNLLLLTATPHMGRNDAYYGLWRLLLPDSLSNREAFEQFPMEKRSKHFLRRTKEELVDYEGRSLFPMRLCNTVGFELRPREQELYERTTTYIRDSYNKAEFLNPEAARLTLGVFQRRLASSSYALMRSLERRCEKLRYFIELAEKEALVPTPCHHKGNQPRDLFDQSTAEESSEDEIQREEDLLIGQNLGSNLKDLHAELHEVQELAELARALYQEKEETKFNSLRQILPDRENNKIIVFTEHRDTLEYLIERFEALGFTEKVVVIHGGLSYREREECIRIFRKPGLQGGADILVATDAAGEGINLQFCWQMVNYDVPWNPARLEQRMGRIHRYGQKSDQVLIFNLVATNTREGDVIKRLLEKLDSIREELGNGKVFDVVGRLFQERELRELLFDLLISPRVASFPDLNASNVKRIAAEEQQLLGKPNTFVASLPDLRRQKEIAQYRHLLPARTLQFLASAGPVLGFSTQLDQSQQVFTFEVNSSNLLSNSLAVQIADSPLPFTAHRPNAWDDYIWLRPGEKTLESLVGKVLELCQHDGRRGAIFHNHRAEEETLIHLAIASVREKSFPESIPQLVEGSHEQPDRILARKLLCLRQNSESELEHCPVDALLDLEAVANSVPGQWDLAMRSTELKRDVEGYLRIVVASEMAGKFRHHRWDDLKQRKLQKREETNRQLATLMRKQKALRRKKGTQADEERDRLKQEILRVQEFSASFLAALPTKDTLQDLIVPGASGIWVSALVVPDLLLPSALLPDTVEAGVDSEEIAMCIAIRYECMEERKVHDVSIPAGARDAGLGQDWPGFDLLSEIPDGDRRCIEVKGRKGIGAVEITTNEWAAACNLRESYWLYVVFHCETDNPILYRVSDPVKSLNESAMSHIHIDGRAIVQAGTSA